MKVLHLNQFGTNAGGVEAYIADVSRALLAAGHQTRLISFAFEDPSGLMPGTTQVDESGLTATQIGIARVIEDFQPDVAYVHAVYDPRVVRYIGSRLPAVSYVHGPYIVCPGNALYLRRSGQVCGCTAGPLCLVNAQIEGCVFGRNLIRHVRRLRQVRALIDATSQVNVLVGSQFMRDRLLANGLRAEKVSLLAPLLFCGSALDYVPALDPRAILYAGRVTLEKGLRRLIQALAPVRNDWQLFVAGDGPDRDACERLAEQLDVRERVHFAGWMASAEMKVLYQRCAFVVVPSLWPEPYGRVGPEAFFHGRPAVAYAVGGIPDWLEDGETGYLATPGDVGSLRRVIVRLIEDPDKCEHMGRTAQKLTSMRWSAKTHVERLLASFRSAVEGFGRGTSQRQV